ncbi:MAG: hypothetical protein ACTS8Z_04790 [Candidatus Limnocylindrales bacterium]
MTQTWRTLALIYPVLDARFGSGLTRRRARRVMTREERSAVLAVLERLPATVLDWSSGLATLEPFDVIEVRRPLGSLSSSGGGRWWVGPREVRRELADVADTGTSYDSVFALWPGDPDVPQCGWGCSLGPSDATFGAGFSSISTDHWRTLATDPDPEQGYVHEWLHQVEAVCRALGVSEADLPPLHDAAAFTSARPPDEPPYGRSYAEFHDGGARTWAPWYRHWMTGRLTPVDQTAAPDRLMGDSPIGLTPERWALRSRR